MTGTAPLDPGTQQRIALPFAIVTLIWGSTWLVIHTQLGVVPGPWSVTYRFALGAIAMVAVALATRVRLRLTAPEQGMAATIGLVTFAVNYNLVYLAEHHVTSGLVAVVFALLVASNAVLARIFFGQGVSRPFLLGSAVAMLGVGLLFAHELHAAARDPHEVRLGIGITLVALVAASIGNVLQSSARARAMPMAALLGWSMAWGAALDGVVAWATSGPPVFEWTAGYVLGLLYLAVVASAVAFTFYFNLIRAIGPARGGYVNVLVPVIAMALSTVFERYRWSPAAALGGMLVLIGLVVAMRARSPAR